MVEQILGLAALIARPAEEEKPLLEAICTAAAANLTRRLRDGVKPEDCGDAFPCAAALLAAEYRPELELLEVDLPDVSKIPCLRFQQAKQLAAEKYGCPIRDPYDLEPEEEARIGRYVKEEYGSDFVFVTHYPSKKRPFYAMDDPDDPRYTLSFDLLFRGMEVTTGGQRVHGHAEQLAKLEDVRNIKELEPDKSVFRELIMIKVRAAAEQRQSIIAVADIFRAKIIDVAPESLIIELTGNQQKIDAFIDLLEGHEILEQARTGIAGLGRGTESVVQIDMV